MLVPFGLFCQTVVPDSVYREADGAIAQSGATGLTGVLSKYSGYPWYSRLEDFVLKKARQLVIQDDLDQASAVSLSVIDANLDNQDAVQLYQSIQRAREEREEERRKAEEKQALAIHKQQAQETKTREEVDKTYKAVVNPSTGKRCISIKIIMTSTAKPIGISSWVLRLCRTQVIRTRRRSSMAWAEMDLLYSGVKVFPQVPILWVKV